MMRGSNRLFLLAAVLTAASLTLPLWGFRMSAPQYPDESLYLRISRGGIGGDVHEVAILQKYIGVRFPARLPELEWLSRGILLLAGLLVLGGIAGRGRLGRIVRWSGAASLVLLLSLSAVAVQARLYAVGHERDANAPITALPDFTPVIVGPTKVGNFTVWSFPHAGGLLLATAAALTLAGVRRRRT